MHVKQIAEKLWLSDETRQPRHATAQLHIVGSFVSLRGLSLLAGLFMTYCISDIVWS